MVPKIYWIHSLVDVSRFTKYRKNRVVTVREMLIDVLKFLFHTDERYGKVIRNAYLGSDLHQKLITSAHAYHVWSMCYRDRELSCSQNNRITDHITPPALLQ